MNEQLILNLGRRRAFNKEDFFVSKSNSLAIKMLDNWKNTSSDSGIIIFGPPACGKSHLAAVWSKETSAVSYEISSLVDINIDKIIEERFFVLEDIEKLDFLPPKNRIFVEEKILHIYNNLNENNGKILFTSKLIPKDWNIELKDLLSRFMSLTVIELNLPDDDLLQAVMAKQFTDRQILVELSVLKYAIPRMERSFLFAKKLVEDLDVEAFKSGKPINIKMVRKSIRSLVAKNLF